MKIKKENVETCDLKCQLYCRHGDTFWYSKFDEMAICVYGIWVRGNWGEIRTSDISWQLVAFFHGYSWTPKVISIATTVAKVNTNQNEHAHIRTRSSFFSRNGTGILSELNFVQKLLHAATDTCNIFDRFAVIWMDWVNVIESTTEKLCQMNETTKKDQHIHSKKWARANIRRHQKS